MPSVFRRLFLAAAVTVSACVSPARPPAAPPAPHAAEREARAAWLGLPSTSNGCREYYDYFPEGGLAIFYCHARSLLSLERLEALAGMPSTREPPAGVPRALALAFRHYDPRFVEWLRGALLPARADARFREQTQPIYDRYVAPLARQYLATRKLMAARRSWTEGEVRWVRERIERGELPERWYAERYEAIDAPVAPEPAGGLTLDRTGWDANVGPNAIAFWIRRELDGSAAAFTAALDELVSIYDGAWLRAGAGVVGVAAPVAAPAPRHPPSGDAPAGEFPVAQVWRDRARLAGRVVQVKGWAVRFDARILGRNWIHVRDGTGTPGVDNDLTVTTSDEADVGEVVTIEGTVSVDRDFGAGYAYPVILESARIVRHGPGTPMPPEIAGSPRKGARASGEAPPEGKSGDARAICGAVREQLPSGPYVYLRLDTAQGEVWAAVPALRVALGERLCVLDPMPMNDFRSDKLKRVFQRIYFGRVER